MAQNYILAIDSGTTSVRALIFDQDKKIVAIAQTELKNIYPKSNYVEVDAIDLWQKQLLVIKEAIKKAKIKAEEIAAIGITNQRETTVIWDKTNGKPVYNAIVWQDKRAAEYCEVLKKTHKNIIMDKTGLVIDAYFSATKIKWIFDNVDGVKESAEKDQLLFGTIDTWLLWNLTAGLQHATDVSNASRTMLFNINELEWDKELLKLFNIPENILPEVKQTADVFGNTDKKIFGTEIPVYALIGDQQSALFGQGCFTPGDAKNTYGTGCFMLMNIGNKAKLSDNGILTTIAWQLDGKTEYAMEAAIFDAGSALKWLRDNLQIAYSYKDIDHLAEQVADAGGVIFVPAFSGLGAPHWDMEAKASFSGISFATTKAHFARAVLEGIALQVSDIIEILEKESGYEVNHLCVDGGLTKSNIMMQIQANFLQKDVIMQTNPEMTACGAAYLAGIKAGIWKKDELTQGNQSKIYNPEADVKSKLEKLKQAWSKKLNSFSS